MISLARRAFPIRRSVGSSAELDRLVGDEDEHVPDLLRFVLLHREDHRVGPPRAKVVHEYVEAFAPGTRGGHGVAPRPRPSRCPQPPPVTLPPFSRGTSSTPDVVRSRTYFARLCVVPRIFTICKVRRRSPRRSKLPVTITPSARASSTPHWEYPSSDERISDTSKVVHPFALNTVPRRSRKSRILSCSRIR